MLTNASACQTALWPLAVCIHLVVLPACGSQPPEKYGFDLETPVTCAVFTPDSKYIIAGGHDRMLLLDVERRNRIERFPRDKDADRLGVPSFEVIAISPDGKYVASAGAWKPVRVWDFQTGQVVHSFPVDKTRISALAFSPNGQRLAAGTSFRLGNGRFPVFWQDVFDIWLWDLSTGSQRPVSFHGHDGPVGGVAFLSDGARIASVSADMTIRLWDVATQHEVRRLGSPKPKPPRQDVSSVGRFVNTGLSTRWSLRCSADGKYLVQGRILVDIKKWQPVRWENKQTAASEKSPGVSWNNESSLTRDSKRLIVGLAQREIDHSGTLWMYDVVSGKTIFGDSVFGNGAAVLAVDISPDDRYALAAGSGNIPGFDALQMGVRANDGCQLYIYRLPPLSSASETPSADRSRKGDTVPSK